MKKLTVILALLLTISIPVSAKKSYLGGEINKNCSKGRWTKCRVLKLPVVPKIVAPFIPVIVKRVK